nr:hypothetical protein [Tanacetum cinerariifolium]
MSGPDYPEYVAPSDDEIPIEDQPLPVDASPIALSPGYATDSDLKEDLEEDPADYPTDGGDEEEEGSSEDDDDEEDDAFKEDENKEEEHLALTGSAAATPPPPPPRSPQTRVPFFLDTIPSPLLHTSPTYADAPLGYRAAMIQLRSTSPLPVTSPPLLLPFADRMSGIPKTDAILEEVMSHCSCSRFEIEESSTANTARETGHTLTHIIDYGFIDTVDASIRASKSRAITSVEKVNKRVTNLATTQRQVAHELYPWSSLEDKSTTLEATIRAHDARTIALEAQTIVLQRDVSVLQRDAGHQDGTVDAGSSSDALAEHEANRNSRNGDDNHDSGSGGRRQVPTTQSIFHISNCTVTCQINFPTCTLLGSALTWWNSHVKTIGHDAAYRMPWKILKKMMTVKYFPRSEIKKLEIEIWNLKESDEVEKYVGGLPEMIQGSVMASKPKTMQDAIEFATELMDQNIRTFADRQAKKKESLMTT